MITVAKFKEALQVIADYEQQLRNDKPVTSKTEKGCRVKLSEWGIEMQGKRKAKLLGTVVDFRSGNFNPEVDGTVVVKWDGIKKPSSMHITQIELLKEVSNGKEK